MEIKAKSKYDQATIRALTHLAMYKKADPKKRIRLWTWVYAILLAVIVLEIIVFGPDSTFFTLLFAAIFFILLVYFMYFIMPKIQYNAMAKMKDIENVFVFGDKEVKIVTSGSDYNCETKIDYSWFHMVYETSKHFFLYQTKNQVFIVDKSTVEGGTAEDIRNKFSGFDKKKYIICKY